MMGRRLFSTSISSYGEYRRRLGRLAELWGVDPMLETPEAEGLLDDIAAYMVDGGELGGEDAEPERAPATLISQQRPSREH